MIQRKRHVSQAMLVQGRLIINRVGRVRSEVWNGHQVLIARAVLIVPGVLSGSHGPLMYPASEVRRSAPAWDGKPLTLGHPTLNGRHVSALTPGVPYLGAIRNPSFTDRLFADAVFDVGATQRESPSLLMSLRKGMPVEVSTGLFHDPITANDRTVRGIIPDHLAVLLDSEGACAIRDGCGLNR